LCENRSMWIRLDIRFSLDKEKKKEYQERVWSSSLTCHLDILVFTYFSNTNDQRLLAQL
jgi:hypothetical protein